MKKLGLATALVLTLAFGAGSVFAQNSNTNTSMTGGTMKAKHSRRHHRRAHHRRHHHKAKAANANT